MLLLGIIITVSVVWSVLSRRTISFFLTTLLCQVLIGLVILVQLSAGFIAFSYLSIALVFNGLLFTDQLRLLSAREKIPITPFLSQKWIALASGSLVFGFQLILIYTLRSDLAIMQAGSLALTGQSPDLIAMTPFLIVLPWLMVLTIYGARKMISTRGNQ